MKPGVALAALLLGACSAPELPVDKDQAREPAAAAPVVPPSAASPSASPRRALRVREVGSGAPAMALIDGVGQPVPQVFDLEDGTRVSAAPGTRLWAFAHAKTLLLVSGELHASRVVDAEQAGRPPVRIACLAGAIESNPGAELTLRVELQTAPVAYRAQLSLSRGSATWISPHEHATLKEAQLFAGEPLPMPAPGLQWLSLRAGEKSRAERDKRFTTLRHAPVTADLDALLDAALTEQEVLRQQSHSLLARVSPRHAALAKPTEASAAPPGLDSPRAYQRELVTQAQRRDAQAKQLLSAAERSLLLALARCGPSEPRTCPSVRAWIARFAARLDAGL